MSFASVIETVQKKTKKSRGRKQSSMLGGVLVFDPTFVHTVENASEARAADASTQAAAL